MDAEEQKQRFAEAALTGLLAGQVGKEYGQLQRGVIVGEAWALAEAMVKEGAGHGV